MTPIIELDNVGKRYRLGDHVGGKRTLRQTLAREDVLDKWVLQGVNLAVAPGEIVGVVGHNGAGKTTLLKVIARVTAPTVGVARTIGSVGSLLEVGAGFFAELTGRENLYLNGMILGMSRSSIDRHFDEIVEFADIGNQLDTPVKRYSSGQYLRLAFAIAAHLDAEIMLVDEVLAVGDNAFQKRCTDKLRSLASEGRTVLYVSHQLTTVRDLCNRCIWLDGGEIRADGSVAETLQTYRSGLAGATPEAAWWSTESVRLTSAGQPIETVAAGEGFELEAAFEVVEPPPAGATALVCIHNVNGTLISEVVVADAATAPGRYVSTAEIPGHLAPGRYSIGVRLDNDQGTTWSSPALRHLEVRPLDEGPRRHGGALLVPTQNVHRRPAD